MRLKRFLACLIDSAAAIFIGANIYLVLGYLFSYFAQNSSIFKSVDPYILLNYILIFCIFLGFLINAFFESKNGYALGKKLIKIHVENIAGSNLNIGKSLIRNLPKIIILTAFILISQFDSVNYRHLNVFLMFVGVALIATIKDGQSYVDKIVGAKVMDSVGNSKFKRSGKGDDFKEGSSNFDEEVGKAKAIKITRNQVNGLKK